TFLLYCYLFFFFFFFSSRRRHTRFSRDCSDVCSSDLATADERSPAAPRAGTADSVLTRSNAGRFPVGGHSPADAIMPGRHSLPVCCFFLLIKEPAHAAVA